MERCPTSKPLRSRSMGLYLEEACNFRCLSGTREERDLSAGTEHVSEPLHSDDRSLRGSLFGLQSVMLFAGTVHNPG